MTTRRNKFDAHDSLELGDSAEQRFAHLAQLRGWQVMAATPVQNIDEHWDFLLQKGGLQFRVDVKAMKRVRRQDAAVQDQWLWIELHGVRPHDPGWLFAGQADLIAFERKAAFLIVKRVDLIPLVTSLVATQISAATPDTAQYKIYSRPGRPDRLTLIETEKLKQLHWVEWPKV